MGTFKLDLYKEILAGRSSKNDTREKKISNIKKTDMQLFKIEKYLTNALVDLKIEPNEIVCESFYDLMITAFRINLKPSTEQLRNERRTKGSYIKIRPLQATLSAMVYFYRLQANGEFKIDKKNVETGKTEKNVNCSKTRAAFFAHNLVRATHGTRTIKKEDFKTPDDYPEIKSLIVAFKEFESNITVTKESIFYLYDVNKKTRKGKNLKVYTPLVKNFYRDLELKRGEDV